VGRSRGNVTGEKILDDYKILDAIEQTKKDAQSQENLGNLLMTVPIDIGPLCNS
jgi:hypothetical protein